ncbi:MAG: helix-turn-helix domain-containing protein [Oxalobacter formigenes]|nr:helix-turn-helix domain-containing protein [Oxalobacter formigenes]
MRKMTQKIFSFGERLVWARTRAGLSLSEFARILETAPSTIAGYENGTRATKTIPEKLFTMARVLNVRAEWLWNGSGSPERSSSDILSDVINQLPEEKRAALQTIILAMKNSNSNIA